MEDFFRIVFGGLAALGLGIVFIYGGLRLARLSLPRLADLGSRSIAAAASIFTPELNDGTTISGLSRVIRYTAVQEEDVIADMTRTLLSGSSDKVSASSYEVKDLTTGTVIAQDDPDKLLPIASLTKLVTAVIAQRLIPPDERIPITPAVLSTYGNTASFKEGEVFTASDLMYPLLMVSSNDAAEAFAQSYGRARFIQAMNQFTQSIGAYRTSFSDPSGLSPLNVSTASDMETILDWIDVHDPSVIAITATQTKTVRAHTWVNPTRFLNWSNYLGGKNGYTDEAESTGASLFTVGPDKDTYAIVVLDSTDRDADIVKLLGKVDAGLGMAVK